MALHCLLRDPAFEAVGLLTTVTEGYERISMHGVRRDSFTNRQRLSDCHCRKCAFRRNVPTPSMKPAWKRLFSDIEIVEFFTWALETFFFATCALIGKATSLAPGCSRSFRYGMWTPAILRRALSPTAFAPGSPAWTRGSWTNHSPAGNCTTRFFENFPRELILAEKTVSSILLSLMADVSIARADCRGRGSGAGRVRFCDLLLEKARVSTR